VLAFAHIALALQTPALHILALLRVDRGKEKGLDADDGWVDAGKRISRQRLEEAR
jgi:hypothetical protein